MLIETKLHPPELRSGLIERPDLERQLSHSNWTARVRDHITHLGAHFVSLTPEGDLMFMVSLYNGSGLLNAA